MGAFNQEHQTLFEKTGRTSLTFKELRTTLVEIEATLNNRPLTYVYDDEQGVSFPLTPASLIYVRRIATTPNESQYEIVSTTKSLTRCAKYQSSVLKNFTDQWRKEYLLSIRESSRVQNNKSNIINVGNIVILKNENTSRMYWKLARVENLQSKDRIVRSVEVKVLSNDNKRTVVLRRPIQHLIPLEVQDTSRVQDTSGVQDMSRVQDTSEVQDMSGVQDTREEVKGQVDTRPRRKAAVNGELFRRKYRWR